MSVKDTFTPIADHLRSEYGTGNLLTVDQIKNGINGLHTRSLIADVPELTQNNLESGGLYPIDNPDLSTWNSLRGKTLTMSFDISYDGYQNMPSIANRIGFEYGVTFEGDNGQYDINMGAWLYPKEISGTAHVFENWTIPDQQIVLVTHERSAYNQLNKEATFKITNIKMVVNPMGGNQA